MKRLALILAIVMTVGLCFTACTKSEPEETPGTEVVVDPVETIQPKIVLDYDTEKFVLDGVTLVRYIGNEEAVEIPDGTVVIGDSAFRGNSTVQTVSFPDTVTTINRYAFQDCTALTTVSVPKLVKEVGDGAFKNCTSLTKVEMKTSATNVGAGCFEGCTSLEEVKLSTSLTIVNDRLFYGCTAIKEVNLVAATTIGKEAFYGCEALTYVNAPACTSVGDYCFYGCKSFGTDEKNKEGGKFSTAFLRAGVEAFEGTAWLANKKEAAKNPKKESEAYVILGNVLLYYSGVFPETSKVDPSKIKLTGSIYTIGSEAFYDVRENLVTLEIPTTVKYIEKAAFKDFDALKTVKVAKSVSVIPNEAFADCDSLESVTLSSGITEIGASAFRNCPALTSVTSVGTVSAATPTPEAPEATPDGTAGEEGEEGEVTATEKPEEVPTEEPVATEEPAKEVGKDVKNKIAPPDSVVTIGDYAFAGCSAVENIFLGNKLEGIGKGAFSGCTAAAAIEIGKKVSEIGIDAFAGTPWFENWTADEETNMLIVGDGVLIKLTAGADVNAPDVKVISAKIEDDEIPDGKYYDNDNWLTVVIPGTVKKIGDNAFYYADNLREVIIEEGVEAIGAGAFYCCRNLSKISLPSTLKTIGDYAFYGCADLTEIVIPEAVTEIGKMAFYNCLNLKDVTIPAGVTEIGAYAFTNTYWRENDGNDYLIVGDGILIRYHLFEDVTVIDESLGIKKIAGGSFAETYRLTEITLPESISELSEFAFSSCNTLVKITAKGVAYLGPRSFNQCSKLTTFEFAAVYAAAPDAFNGCTALNIGDAEEPTETEVEAG